MATVSQTYMGRLFAAPLDQSGAGSVVYVNFGWNSKGNQVRRLPRRGTAPLVSRAARGASAGRSTGRSC